MPRMAKGRARIRGTAARPSSAITVRPARRKDAETLVEFSAAMAEETEGRTLDRARLRRGILGVFDDPARGFYLVAVAGARNPAVVGQLFVTYEWSDWRSANFWWIQSVYVRRGWRRRGVYRAMHRYVAEQARAMPDVCGLRLYVEHRNRVAQRVYGRVGLRPSAYRVFEEDFVLTPPDAGRTAGETTRRSHASRSGQPVQRRTK